MTDQKGSDQQETNAVAGESGAPVETSGKSGGRGKQTEAKKTPAKSKTAGTAGRKRAATGPSDEQETETKKTAAKSTTKRTASKPASETPAPTDPASPSEETDAASGKTKKTSRSVKKTTSATSSARSGSTRAKKTTARTAVADEAGQDAATQDAATSEAIPDVSDGVSENAPPMTDAAPAPKSARQGKSAATTKKASAGRRTAASAKSDTSEPVAPQEAQSDTPDTPDMPDMPDTPDMPDMPDAAATPDMPDTVEADAAPDMTPASPPAQAEEAATPGATLEATETEVAEAPATSGKTGRGRSRGGRSGAARNAARSRAAEAAAQASEAVAAPSASPQPDAEDGPFGAPEVRDDSSFDDFSSVAVAAADQSPADFPSVFDQFALPDDDESLPLDDDESLSLAGEERFFASEEEDSAGDESPFASDEDGPAEFPTAFGDAGPEDFFALGDVAYIVPDTLEDAQDGDDGSDSEAGSGSGEKRRRSRSRRGRGRKKAAAQAAALAAAEAAGALADGDDGEDGEDALHASAASADPAVAVDGDDEDDFDDDGRTYAFEDDDEDDDESSGRAAEADAKAAGKVGRRKMFVSVLPDEQVEVVITEEGQVQEYYVEMLHQAKTKGNIYKGIVHNVDPNLQAAFVSYGAVKNGFLQIDEVHPEYYVAPHDGAKGRKYPPIQKVLKSGQELLVQVVKEPAGTKGAFLTTYLSLPGRFLVLTPGREQIGVSRKVENETERARLREMLEGLSPGPGLGVIVRTVSMGASKTSLQRDLQFLKRTWKDVRTRGTTEKAPCLVYQEMDLTARAVRDYLTEAIGEVWIDDEATATSVTEIAEALFPRKQNLVRVHKDTGSTLFERFNIQRQLDQIHSREVALPSGGRLVIDPTEALTAIDINSGRSSGKSNFEDMAYRTNMEAAKMIPLQLRLRDIGGQVVADFIEMRDKNHWREVERTLRNGMKVDRARYDVGKIGPFGMLEIVRQRLGSSAISISTEPCPCCNGTGVRRNMEWQSQHALRDLLRAIRQAQSQNESVLVYAVEQPLALHLLNNKRQRLLEMEQQFGVRLDIQIKQPELS